MKNKLINDTKSGKQIIFSTYYRNTTQKIWQVFTNSLTLFGKHSPSLTPMRQLSHVRETRVSNN